MDKFIKQIVISKHTCNNYDVILKGESMGYNKHDVREWMNRHDVREWMNRHAIYGEDGDGYFSLDQETVGDDYGYNKELIHIFEELLKESNGQTIMIMD